MTPTAVLWDMDGLLVDTEPMWTVAEVELAAALGGTWTDEIKAAVVGTRLDVSVPTILRWYEVEPTPARVAETAAWLLHRVAELYSGALPARAGVCELLAALREEGVADGPGVVVVPGAGRRSAGARLRGRSTSRWPVTRWPAASLI